MGAHKLDPSRLDVASMAAEGTTLSGQWAATELDRWEAAQTPAPGATLAPVQWRVRGERRGGASVSPQSWLHLHVEAAAWLTCQRCLRPFSERVAVNRALRFVDGDAQAEALDADSEDDVLALVPALDLRTLVEDELLLGLPIVPRHEQCAAPDHRAGDEGAAAASPFAALALLKPPAAGG